MIGLFIAMISGALMSVQGVFNTQVTKASSIWATNCFVQFSALLVCVAAWFFTGRQGTVASLFAIDNKYKSEYEKCMIKYDETNDSATVVNKFNALKDYCRDYKIKWGFVRDMDGGLYINNTTYVEDMKDKRWITLKEVF